MRELSSFTAIVYQIQQSIHQFLTALVLSHFDKEIGILFH